MGRQELGRGFALAPSNVIPTKRKPNCHPDQAKRVEGSPDLERILSWKFPSFEMAGGKAASGKSYP